MQLSFSTVINKYLYILIWTLLGVVSLAAQLSIQHENRIKSLSLDGDKQLLVLDNSSNYFHFVNGQLTSTTLRPAIDSLLATYEIQNGNQLKRSLGAEYNLFDLPFSPSSMTLLDQDLLLTEKEGLWILDGGRPKKYFVPGIDFPANIQKIYAQGSVVAMLTAEMNLFMYHTEKQELKFVSNQVTDFTIDGTTTLWYARQRQLANDNSFATQSLPLIKITSVRTQTGRLLDLPYTLEPDQAAVKIDFLLRYPPLMDAAKLAYSINDGTWRSVQSKSQVFISDLQRGTNTIRFRAKGIDDIVAYSDSVVIKIEEPSLTRFWPWLVLGIGLLFAMAFVSQLRLRSEMQALNAEKDKIRLQLQVANEKQKLGLMQMNPHFIFNTLNSISGLIALNENKKARTYLNDFSKMMRKVLDHSQKDFIPLADELAFLEAYIRLEQMIRNDKFDYEIINKVEKDCLVPPMIIQPFVENAIIHGMNPNPAKGHLVLSLDMTGKNITIKVSDNGIGRAAAAKNKKNGHESAAIKIIEQRLKYLNKWDSLGVNYEDLYDDDNEPAGTKVTIQLPTRKK